MAEGSGGITFDEVGIKSPSITLDGWIWRCVVLFSRDLMEHAMLAAFAHQSRHVFRSQDPCDGNFV